MNRKLLLFVVLFCTWYYTFAQNDDSQCVQSLRLAQSIYDEGRLPAIPALLEDCLKGTQLSAQEKVAGYRLLTLTYIYLEEPALADENYLKILQTDPYFRPSPGVDPPEFVALHKTFRTHPVYRLGARIGINGSKPNVSKSVYVIDGHSEYTPNISLTTGAVVEIPINNWFTINPELRFELKSFTYDNAYEVSPPSEVLNTTEGPEKQTWVTLPITVQYSIFGETDTRSNLNPYLAAGASVNYLLNSNINLQRTRANASPVTPTTTGLNPQREKIVIDAVVAAGVKYRMGGGFVVGEVRLNYGITAVSSMETAFENQQLAFSYGYGDNVFKVNTLSLTVGYIQNFFNPKKLSPKEQ